MSKKTYVCKNQCFNLETENLNYEIMRFKNYLKWKLQVSYLNILEIMPYHCYILFQILETEKDLLETRINELNDVGYPIKIWDESLIFTEKI